MRSPGCIAGSAPSAAIPAPHSARIIGKAAGVCIETLDIKGMARTRLALSVGDAGMGELHRQIPYKAQWSGRQVVRAGV